MNRRAAINLSVVLVVVACLTGATAALAQDQQPDAAPPATTETSAPASPAAWNVYESEENDGFDTKDVIHFGDVMGGRMQTDPDKDYFRFTVNGTANVLFDLDSTWNGGAILPTLCLYDSGGIRITCGSASNDYDPSLFYRLYSGTYYVLVAGTPYAGVEHSDYELVFSSPLLVSATTGGTVAGISFQAADILAWSALSGGNERWSMFFDASDLGITRNLTNIGDNANGNLLLGFAANQSLGGLGTATPYDIVEFEPSWPLMGDGGFGPDTDGAFTWYYRGKQQQLTTTAEKIDALTGYIGLNNAAWCWGNAMSTAGVAKRTDDGITTTFADEDLLCVEDGGSGWEPYWMNFLDGSTISGLGVEDVIAADYEDAPGAQPEWLYLTILGNGKVGGTAVNQKTIFAVNYGNNAFDHIVWRGQDHGWNYNIDAFDYDPN